MRKQYRLRIREYHGRVRAWVDVRYERPARWWRRSDWTEWHHDGAYPALGIPGPVIDVDDDAMSQAELMAEATRLAMKRIPVSAEMVPSDDVA